MRFCKPINPVTFLNQKQNFYINYSTYTVISRFSKNTKKDPPIRRINAELFAIFSFFDLLGRFTLSLLRFILQSCMHSFRFFCARFEPINSTLGINNLQLHTRSLLVKRRLLIPRVELIGSKRASKKKN